MPGHRQVATRRRVDEPPPLQATRSDGVTCEDAAARREAGRKLAAGTARYVAERPAAALVRSRWRLDRLLPRAARAELLLQLARDAAGVAGARPLQPVLPRAGAGGARPVDHVEGDGDPGDVHGEAELRGIEADDEVRDGGACIREYGQALEPSRVERRDGERAAARHRRAVVADAALRIRADGSVRRAALLGGAACRQRPERAGVVRPVERAPLPAVGREGDLCGCGRDRRGEGGAIGGGRLPAAPGAVPEARRPDPARGAARRAAGDGQDAACARSRGRGGRAVLRAGSVGVRRGDRRRRRLARPRPVQAGERGGAGDRLHRRTRCRGALAHLRVRRLLRR